MSRVISPTPPRALEIGQVSLAVLAMTAKVSLPTNSTVARPRASPRHGQPPESRRALGVAVISRASAPNGKHTCWIVTDPSVADTDPCP
jgi:hypothetical protein